MAWTLHLLLWIAVATASGYKYPIKHLGVEEFSLDYNQDSGRSASRLDIVNVSGIEEAKILNSNSRRGIPDTNGGNPIVFPGPTSRSQLVLDIPKECQKSTFCEEVPGYPQEAISRFIDQEGFVSRVETIEQADVPDITQRVGPPEDNVELCYSVEKIVYPQSVKSTDGKWYTLVNRKDNPVQGFRVEICKEDESACKEIAVFQRGYTARCKQKYVLRTVTAVDPSQQELRAIDLPVKVPSCCSCVAKADISNR